jgi:beta-glucosidase
VLKQRMGFDGFVISDWQAIDQLPGDYASDIRTSINAGLDMIMVPTNYQGFTQGLTDEVTAGRVPMTRVDDAVRRILTEKFKLGLFEHPYADTTNIATIGSAAHRAVGRESSREVPGAVEERREPVALGTHLQGVRSRQQRQRPGQPDGRLEHHLAGGSGPTTSGHDDPGRDQAGGADGNLQRRRIGTAGGSRRRRRRGRRTPVRRRDR